MALRYWVGGTASWDGTAGTKWALTSGGAGGQAVPTSADDVFLDANSGAATVTVTGTVPCKSLDCTGFTGILTGQTTPVITFAGNCTWSSTMSVNAVNGATLTFTSGTALLTTAGKTVQALSITGGTLTLNDALNLQNSVTITGGTFSTSASNYSITTTAGAFVSSGTTVRTINLNGSTIAFQTGGTIINLTGSNATFSAGTSTFTTAVTTALTVTGNNYTFYNLSFTGAGTSASTITINGANTYNNLSITAPASGLKPVLFAANNTISGTLTCSGASGIRRIWLRSSVLGAVRTLTVASCSPLDCDFRDITIAGAAAPVSGTRLGDCGGNSGITFPAAKTVYWNPAATADFGSASWATSSGSTTLSDANFPLAQDTAVFDNNSRAGVGTNTGAAWNVGTIDMSSRTTALTWTMTVNGLNIHGSFLFGTGITSVGAFNLTFLGRSTQTITSNGRTFAQHIVANGSALQLADALTTSGNFTLNTGIFDAVTYNVTASTGNLSVNTARTLTMGSGTWTLTGLTNVWVATTTTNLTFNKGTANIILSNTTTGARTFAGGGLTYNKLTIGGATGTSTLTFTGSNTFSELASTKTVAHTILFTAATTTTVGAWTITGTAGNVVTIGSVTAATHTLTKTGGGVISADYLSISNSTATPATTWYAGANSTNGGGNSGWIFTVPPPVVNTGNFLALF